MTLSKRLRDEVSKKLKIKSHVQLWRRVNTFAVDRKIADRDVALLMLAYEEHVDVRKPRYSVPQKKLDKFEEELKAQKTATPTPVFTIAQSRRKGKRISSKQILIELGKGIKVTDPLLPTKLVVEATQMANVYPVLYVFENSVRNLVSQVMSAKYSDKWWDQKVGSTIKKKVLGRIQKEHENRWHGKRGAHPIFYTDIEDLKSIITTNWQDFKDLFPSQQWVSARIDEIEMSRNVVAHNNPLEKRDIQRLELYLGDWIRQISKSS
jgi:hypothetical protein